MPGFQSTPTYLRRFRQLQAYLLGWGAIGLSSIVVLSLLGAPVWAYSGLLLVWCLVWGAGVVWAQASDASVNGMEAAHVSALPCVAEVDESAQAIMSEADQEVLRYALSHDLRAPLRVVDGFTRILKEDYGRALDKVGNDHLERVLAASARMSGMIDAILAQAQLGRTALERQPIDMSQLAREVAADLADWQNEDDLAGGRAPGAGLAKLLVADGLRAEGDPMLVRRVLENLVGNALKYSAKVAQPCIEVGAMPATNPTVFFVRDNGAGFDMRHADKLFGLFQRLHSAKEFEGTGVGLAGVKNIIARHGGRVWAEAHLGQGACFYFTLISVADAQQHLP